MTINSERFVIVRVITCSSNNGGYNDVAVDLMSGDLMSYGSNVVNLKKWCRPLLFLSC